jgi:hypothetical protein
LPEAQIAMASARRRANQCEVSATSGMKAAADPTPISTPWIAANSQRFGASAASA